MSTIGLQELKTNYINGDHFFRLLKEQNGKLPDSMKAFYPLVCLSSEAYCRSSITLVIN